MFPARACYYRIDYRPLVMRHLVMKINRLLAGHEKVLVKVPRRDEYKLWDIRAGKEEILTVQQVKLMAKEMGIV